MSADADRPGGMTETLRRRLGAPGPLLPVVLGVAHFAVDASSNFLLSRMLPWMGFSQVVFWFAAYNFLAFAIQPLVGIATDRLQSARATTALGLALAAVALVMPVHLVWLPLVVTGVGNAAFHVGAGTLSMRATLFRATGPGLFIAPGAVGLALGAVLGKTSPAAAWPILGALVLFAVLTPLLPSGAPERTARPRRAPVPASDRAGLPIALLLVAIAIRSLVGLRVVGRFGAEAGWLVPLAVAAFVGKAFGGIAADAIGWTRTAVCALLASAALLVVADRSVLLAAPGVVLFQVVTSVTLAALFRVMPERPATAFGLTCLALFLGALPVLLRLDLSSFAGASFDAALAAVSALSVWVALSMLRTAGETVGGGAMPGRDVGVGAGEAAR